MQQSSGSIGSLAAALARAQVELINPEKSMVASIRPEDGTAEQIFRYAPLSSGLDIVRKTLGQHEIATVQTTSLDQTAGIINLKTVLAHSSGQWISSDWPVCSLEEMASPKRMGAALTYARRYALFALVGIAGEDDLDAPDLHAPNPGNPKPATPVVNGGTRPDGGNGHFAPKHSKREPAPSFTSANTGLRRKLSAVLRDQLLSELNGIKSPESAAVWARRILPAKNTLAVEDARLLEEEFEVRLAKLTARSAPTDTGGAETANKGEGADVSQGRADNNEKSPPLIAFTQSFAAEAIDKSELVHPEPRRIRDKDHLRFVAKQPCLVCGRMPADPHHLRFAQHRALGRKVSDEWVVALCRGHHREVHRHGAEVLWWKSTGIDPTLTARALWLQTHPLQSQPTGINAVSSAGALKG